MQYLQQQGDCADRVATKPAYAKHCAEAGLRVGGADHGHQEWDYVQVQVS